MVSYLRDKSKPQGRRKRVSRGPSGPSRGEGAGPLPVGDLRARRHKSRASFKNPPDSRNSSPSRKGTDPSLSYSRKGWDLPSALLTIHLFVCIRAASSFSLPRKKQRGPKRGVISCSPCMTPLSGLSPVPSILTSDKADHPTCASQGRAISPRFLCQSVRRSPERRRGAAGTPRAFVGDIRKSN